MPIFQDGKLTLNATIKKNFDQSSFLKFLFWQQPTSILFNIHRFAWRFGSTIWPCCGGPGPDQVVAVCNLNNEDSTLFAHGAKAQG